MKATIKTKEELEIMTIGGKKLAEVLRELIKTVKVGDSLLDIEGRAFQMLLATGGEPGFALVPGYKWATCLNVGDGVVHGIPNEYVLKDGDRVSIDIGLFYKGFHSDMSYTIQVGTQDKKTQRFLEAGKTAINAAIKQIKDGSRVGNISQVMQETIESFGYNCVPELTGHGIGRELHEYPYIPNVLYLPIGSTPLLRENMTIAVEIIYVEGSPKIYTDKKDGWTIKTYDGKMAAVFEKTIAVTRDGYLVLTE